jgi:hypothetical protein
MFETLQNDDYLDLRSLVAFLDCKSYFAERSKATTCSAMCLRPHCGFKTLALSLSSLSQQRLPNSQN